MFFFLGISTKDIRDAYDRVMFLDLLQLGEKRVKSGVKDIRYHLVTKTFCSTPTYHLFLYLHGVFSYKRELYHITRPV